MKTDSPAQLKSWLKKHPKEAKYFGGRKKAVEEIDKREIKQGNLLMIGGLGRQTLLQRIKTWLLIRRLNKKR